MHDCTNTERIELAQAGSSCAAPAVKRRGPVAAFFAVLLISAALMFAMPSLAYASQEAGSISSGDSPTLEVSSPTSSGDISVNKAPDKPDSGPTYSAKADLQESSKQQALEDSSIYGGNASSYTAGDNKSSNNDKDSDDDSDSASSNTAKATEYEKDSNADSSDALSNQKDDDDSTDDSTGALSNSTDELTPDNQGDQPTGSNSKTDDVIATPNDKGSADQTVGAASGNSEEVTPDKSIINSDDSTDSLNSLVVATPAATPDSNSVGTQGTELTPQAEGITIYWNLGWSAKPSAISAVTPYDATTAPTGYRTLGSEDDPIFDNTGKKIGTAGGTQTLASAQEGVDLGLDKGSTAYYFRYGYSLTQWCFYLYNTNTKAYTFASQSTFKNLSTNSLYTGGKYTEIIAYPIYAEQNLDVAFYSAVTNSRISGYGGKLVSSTVWPFPEHTGTNNQWTVYKGTSTTDKAPTPATEGMSVFDMVNTLTNFRSATQYDSTLWPASVGIGLRESENSTSFNITFEVGSTNTGKVTVSGATIKVDNNGTTKPTTAQINAAGASATDANKQDGWVLDGTKWAYTMGTTNGTINSLADLANITITADMKLSPIMKQNTYSVVLNGGKAAGQTGFSNATTPVSAATYTTAVALGNPTWTGRTFAGWYTTQQSAVGATPGANDKKINTNTAYNTINTTISSTANEDTTSVTLYAWWNALTVPVKFDGNTPATGLAVNSVPANTSVNYGDSYTITTTKPTANGYDFAGWATSAAGAVAYAAGATIPATALTDTTNGITLFAKWTEKTGYKVTFFANQTATADGTAYNTQSNLNWMDNVTVPSNPTAPAGYSFGGWYTTKSGTTASGNQMSAAMSYKALLALVNSSLTDSTKEIKMYAKWDELGKLTFTMNLNGSGASYNSSTSNYVKSDVLYNGSVSIPNVTNPTRTGYNFRGWSDSASGAANATYIKGYTFNNVTANKTIYAVWEAAPVTLTYAQGPSGSTLAGVTNKNANASAYTVNTNYAATVTVPAGSTMFERNGYTFANWAYAKTSGTGSVAVGGGSLAFATSGISIAWTGSSEDGTLTGTAVVYPNWTENSYTIKWDTDGGNTINNTTGLKGDSSITEPAVPTRAGYRFLGWYSDSSRTGDPDVVTGNFLRDTWSLPASGGTVTAYAKWQEKVVEIRFFGVSGKSNIKLGTSGTPAASLTLYVGEATGRLYPSLTATTPGTGNISDGVFPVITDTTHYEWKVYTSGNDAAYTSKWTVDNTAGATVADTWRDATSGKLTVNKASTGVYVNKDYCLTVSPKKYKYTVEYYNQNLADNNYSKVTSPSDSGYQFYGHSVRAGATSDATGTTLTVVPATQTGFTYNEAASGSVPQITIGDVEANNVLKFYYDRNKYTLTVTYTGTRPAGTNYSPATAEVKYGQTVTLTNPTVPAGYNFAGWSASGITFGGTATPKNQFTMPASNVAVTGTWSVQTVNVTFKVASNGTLNTNSPNGAASQTKTFGETLSAIPAVNVTKSSDYYFMGWALYTNCTTAGNETTGTLDRIYSREEILGTGAYVGNAWTVPAGNSTFVARIMPTMVVSYVGGTGSNFATINGSVSGTTVTTGGTYYAALPSHADNPMDLPQFCYSTAGYKNAAGFEALGQVRNANNPKAAAGYKFVGWTWEDKLLNETKTCRGYYNASGVFVKLSGDDMPTSVNQSYTFTGVWEKTYQQLHFVNTCVNGTGVTGGTAPADVCGQMGDNLALPTATNYAPTNKPATAYTFKGWTTSTNYKTGDPLYNTTFQMTAGTQNTALYTMAQAVADGGYGVTLYPVFEEKNVTINYALATGSGSMGNLSKSTETIKQASGTAAGSTATANTGYKFVGWFDNAAHTGTPLSTNAAYVPTKTGDIYTAATYYAYYEAEEYTATFKIGDHGTWSNPAGSTADKTFTLTYNTAYGSNVPATTANPGYGFQHWVDQTGKTYSTSVLQTTKITGPMTFTAVWVERSGYTIDFETNGGTPSLASKQVTWTANLNGSMDASANNLKKQGYTFGGWFAKADFSDASKIVAADTFQTGIDKAGITVTGDTATLTLYAKWTPNTYTITYKPNWPATNTTTFADRTAQWTDTNLLPPTGETLSMDGYTFTRWVAKNGTTTKEVTNLNALSEIYVALYGATDYSATKTITIEAEWGTKTYSVKFQDPSGTQKTIVNNLKWSDTVNYYTYDAGPAKRLVGWKFTPVGGSEQQWTNASQAKLVSEIGGDVSQATNGKTYILTAILEDNTAYTIQFYKVNRDATGTPNVAGATEVTGAKKNGYLTPGQANNIKSFRPVGQNDPSNMIDWFKDAFKTDLVGYVLDETVAGTKTAVVAAEVTAGGSIAFKVYYVEKMLDVEYLLGQSAIGSKPYAGTDTAPATKNLGWNSTSVLPDTTPTWDGYKAPKWQYMNASGTWVDVPAGAKVSTIALNDDTKTKVQLRALWESDQVRITYSVQTGGNASNGAGFTVAAGNSKYQDINAVDGVPYTMTATATSGYVFEGWYLNGTKLAGGAATITPQKGADGLYTTSTYEAHFRALGAINYTIEHYFEALDGTYVHDASKDATRSGEEFSTINKTADMENAGKGFAFKAGITGEKLTITSLVNGEVLKLYYERKEHAVRVQTFGTGADHPTTVPAPTYAATGITQASTTQKFGSTLTLPTIDSVDGWSVKWNVIFTDSDASASTTLVKQNGETFVMPNAPVDIIAVWTREGHNVSFNAGDAPNSHGTVEVLNGKTLPFTVAHGKLLTDTSSTGNYFDIKVTPENTWVLGGWEYIDADGQTKTTQDPNSVVINSDIVFKALWAQTYTVIYSPDCIIPGVGNHGGAGFTSAVVGGQDIAPTPVKTVNEFPLMIGSTNVTTEAPAAAGYRFIGWTWENAGNAYYWINPAVTSFDTTKLSGTAASMDFEVTGNVFFRAIWEAMEQDLSYRLQTTAPESQWSGKPAQDGTANTDPYVVTPKPHTDEIVTLLNGADVYRDGYNFIGWAIWTDANGDGIITDDELGKPNTGSTFKMPAKAVVLVPVWEFDSIKVSFAIAADSAGKGTISKFHENISNPTAPTLNGTQATANAGYAFAGWYADAACTIKVDDSWVANGLLTVHMPAGGWTPATYYAKFVAGSTEYTIEYYLQNNDDSYSMKESHRYGDIPTEGLADVMDLTNPASQHILDFDGYNFDSTVFESVLRAEVLGDGSTVLKLYYKWTPYEITVNYIKNDIHETFDTEVLTGVRVPDPTVYVLPETYISDKRPVGYLYEMQEVVSIEGLSLVVNVYYTPVSFFVNFNANGGKFDDGKLVLTYNGLNKDSKPADNIGDTKPALMGYALGNMPVRWNTKANGTGMWLDVNTTFEQLALELGNGVFNDAALMVNGITLYAIWSERSDLEVIYDLNNDPAKNPNIIKNVPDFLNPEIIEDMTGVRWSQDGLNITHQAEWYAAPHGYRFVGWNTKADGTGLTIKDATRYSEISRYLNPNEVLSSITLYAQWEEIIVRIEYTTEEGGTINRFVDNVSAVTGQHVGEGSSAGDRLTSIATAKPGYHFVKWELVTGAREGGLSLMADYLYNQDNDWKWNEDGTITITDPGEFGRLYSATYIARFEANPITTIRYHVNSERGTGTIADTAHPHGTLNISLSDGKGFHLSHYTLVRWNTKEDGTGDWYDLGQKMTMPEEGFDLYAIWDINSYGVKVEGRNDWVGSVKAANTKIEWGQPLSPEFISSVTAKANRGSNFVGWHYRMVDADTGEVIEGIIDDLSELTVLGELEIEALFETTAVPNTMPQTGDHDILFVMSALVLMALGLFIVALFKLRKKDEEDEEGVAYYAC